MSLARLQRDQGRIREAHDLFSSVYSRFSEGFSTANLLAAKQLLNELADAARLEVGSEWLSWRLPRPREASH